MPISEIIVCAVTTSIPSIDVRSTPQIRLSSPFRSTVGSLPLTFFVLRFLFSPVFTPVASDVWAVWPGISREGVAKSLSEFFRGKYPAVINRFVSLMRLVKHRRVRSALRVALHEDQEFAL